MSDIFPPAQQRPALLRLAEILDSRSAALRRDDCGDWAIFGKYGHIYAISQELAAGALLTSGFQLMIDSGTARQWSFDKKRLKFCQVTQDGDCEGGLILDRLPIDAEAALIGDVLGIPKARHLSEEQRRFWPPPRLKGPLGLGCGTAGGSWSPAQYRPPAGTVLEHDYWPRKEFVEFHRRRERWAVLICHRRAGKTFACLNDLLLHAFRTQNGRYAYIAPLYNQAKGIAWDLLKTFSRPFLAHPPHEAELRCDLWNGARIPLYGADNVDRLRGRGFDGVILDEFADMAPSLWGSVVRPALADRGGYGVIIGTIKGRNHLWQTYVRARDDPAWFTALLRASETGRLSAEELADAKEILSPEQYESEFECNEAAAIQGAYWGKELSQAEEENRIRAVPVEPNFPVNTAWDLGIGDSTAIWFFQAIGNEIRVVDFYESHGKGLDHYVAELTARGYTYGTDFVPHDAKVRELGTGRTRIETLIELGRKPRLVSNQKLMDGINAVRLLLPRMFFDAERCADGLEALRQYQTEYDEKTRAFKDTPKHDWSSHAADACRYMCLAYRETIAPKEEPKKPPKPLFKSLDNMTMGDWINAAEEPRVPTRC